MEEGGGEGGRGERVRGWGREMRREVEGGGGEERRELEGRGGES